MGCSNSHSSSGEPSGAKEPAESRRPATSSLPERFREPTIRGKPKLPPEIRLQIWQDALYEPLRIVMLGVHILHGTRDLYDRNANISFPMGGEFYCRKGRAHSDEKFKTNDDAVQRTWPSSSYDIIKTLSLVCCESRHEVTSMYPDIIRVSTTGASMGPMSSLRCNMKEDVFLLEIGLKVEVRSRWDSGFFVLPPRCYGDICDLSTFLFRSKRGRQYRGTLGHWDADKGDLVYTSEILPPSGHFAAAKNDEFCRSLKAMRKLAFISGFKNHRGRNVPQPTSTRHELMLQWWPFSKMITLLPNLEIVYFLPPHINIGDEQDLRAQPFRLDDVWRPRSGRTWHWTNPHSYIEKVKRKFPNGDPFSPEVMAMTSLRAEKIYDLALAAHGGLAKFFCSPVNNDLNRFRITIEELARTLLGLDSRAHSRVQDPVVHKRAQMASMAKEGKLPTIGLLLPGSSYTGETIDLETLSRDRMTTDDEPYWGSDEDYQMTRDDEFSGGAVERPLSPLPYPQKNMRYVHGSYDDVNGIKQWVRDWWVPYYLYGNEEFHRAVREGRARPPLSWGYDPHPRRLYG